MSSRRASRTTILRHMAAVEHWSGKGCPDREIDRRGDAVPRGFLPMGSVRTRTISGPSTCFTISPRERRTAPIAAVVQDLVDREETRQRWERASTSAKEGRPNSSPRNGSGVRPTPASSRR